VSPTAQHKVQQYLLSARWFGGKGRDLTVVDVRRAAVLQAAEPEVPKVGIELVTVDYSGGQQTDVEVYQMPLAYYSELQDRLEHALVGSWDDEELGEVHAYDAVHDRFALALFLAAFDAELRQPGADGTELVFHRLPGHELDLESHSTLFSGEQSNSSVAFGEDSLMKVFRKVTPGRNPDIVIHEALTARQSEHVASLYGWLELTPAAEDEEPLQLAMLQQFLRTASDGWDLALASVRDLFAEADLRADEVGGDFASESERLGLATAQVHDALADAFETEEWGAKELTAVSEGMLARLDVAASIVAELEPFVDGLREVFRGVAEVAERGAAAIAQRVHGDFHLGQTLRTVKGWKIVDFEGEPAKPLSDRVVPDLVWRDVAGMLRSFDYAAHAVEADVEPGSEAAGQIAFRAAEWAERNTSAFIRGYVDNSGRTQTGELSPEQDLILRAYVADKAVYEAVYEARNRPTWLSIPLGAIERITIAAAGHSPDETDPDSPAPTPEQEANG
jgi:maltokinase